MGMPGNLAAQALTVQLKKTPRKEQPNNEITHDNTSIVLLGNTNEGTQNQLENDNGCSQMNNNDNNSNIGNIGNIGPDNNQNNVAPQQTVNGMHSNLVLLH
jgi:hypothetical protein